MSDRFDLDRMLGGWSILATSYGFWRTRTHPRVHYARRPDGTVRDVLTFKARGLLGGWKDATLAGIDTPDPHDPKRFEWRGDGLLRIIRSPWRVVLLAPDDRWAATYFGRSNVGTAAGVDVYARADRLEPDLVRTILEEARAADPEFRAASSGMFQTVHDGVPEGFYGF